MTLHSMLRDEPVSVQCSRAGCVADATVAIEWRNPKIHTEDRIKTWLSCDEHREYLSEFLRARNFPVNVAPVGGSTNTPGDETGGTRGQR